MSRRALLVGCVLAAGVAGRSARAQDTRAMAALIDSAHEKAVVTREQLETYRRTGLLRAARWTDSLMIAGGRVKVLFNKDAAPYARAGVAEAEAQLKGLGDFQSRLPLLEFSIGPDSRELPNDLRPDSRTSVRFHPKPNLSNATSAMRDPESIAEVIVGKVTEVAVSRAGTGLIRWRRESLPLDASAWNRTEWGTLRLDIVSSTSFLGRRCHGGDIAACRLFLGFDPVTDPLLEYYDAAGRRALVRTLAQKASRANPASMRRCEAGADADCVTVLRLMTDWDRTPASEYARRTLLARALTLGGERAPERLLMSTGSAREALSAAAGVPLDTLIAGWQRDMRDRAAASSNLSLPIVVSSLLSIGICLFLALRSSRWR